MHARSAVEPERRLVHDPTIHPLRAKAARSGSASRLGQGPQRAPPRSSLTLLDVSRWARTSQSDRTTRAGFPAATTFGGRSFVTIDPGADHGVLPDRDTREHDDPTAQPDVSFDRDRFGSLPFGPSGVGVDGVRRRQELHVGTDLHVVADRDRRDVERDEPVVHERPRTNPDPVPVIASQGRLDLGSFAELPEELEKETVSLGGVVDAGLVEAIEEPRRPCLFFGEDGVVGQVELSGQHALAHRPFAGGALGRRHRTSLRRGRAASSGRRCRPGPASSIGDRQPSSAITDSGMSKFA